MRLSLIRRPTDGSTSFIVLGRKCSVNYKNAILLVVVIEPIKSAPVLAVNGRPLTAKGRVTRSRIVDAASRLILNQGVERTTILDIQREAGVNASQLYHYFADKEELIFAVVDHQAGGVLDVHRTALSGLDSFEQLQAWRDLVVEGTRARGCIGGCPVGSLAANLAETDQLARGALQNAFASWESLLRGGVASMRARGLLRPDVDPDELALALLAAVQGGLLLSQTRRDSRALEAALDTAIGYLHTLGPRGGGNQP